MDTDTFDQFRIGMRITSRRPIGWISPGWPGFVSDLFPTERFIGVVFDHTLVTRLVTADDITPLDLHVPASSLHYAPA